MRGGTGVREPLVAARAAGRAPGAAAGDAEQGAAASRTRWRARSDVPRPWPGFWGAGAGEHGWDVQSIELYYLSSMIRIENWTSLNTIREVFVGQLGLTRLAPLLALRWRWRMFRTTS